MLIGIDASRANREQKSGVEWYAYNLISHLAKVDFENQYFLYTDKQLTLDLLPRQPNFKEKILTWPLNRFWTLGRLSLEMLFKKPDLLFIPSHTFPVKGGRSNVITWHDVGYERYPEAYNRWDLISLRQGIKRALKMADQIIAISQFTKEELMRIYNIPESKIAVVYLGCHHDRFQPAVPQSIKAALKHYRLDRPYFIYLGRLTAKKNITGLIRAYNLFRQNFAKPHYLLLVGAKGPEDKEIDEVISRLTYGREIRQLGWVPQETLPVLISGAVALVSASIYEGFGLPVIETMACGVPVIVSTSGSFPEIVQSAGLLRDAHDVKGFAQGMQQLSEDQSLRQNLINQGLKRAKDFSWDKCAVETLRVFKNLTN